MQRLLFGQKMKKQSKTEIATFAGGCFWHIEDIFDRLPGVLSTQVGYIGGKMPEPTYEKVCSLDTGHVEATEVTFDPKKISYEDLLKVFWNIHDPTTKDRQGPDVGSQYNSAIFYNNLAQKKAADKSKAERQRVIGKKIVTQIRKAEKFWPAEGYHQKYYEKHGIRH